MIDDDLDAQDSLNEPVNHSSSIQVNQLQLAPSGVKVLRKEDGKTSSDNLSTLKHNILKSNTSRSRGKGLTSKKEKSPALVGPSNPEGPAYPQLKKSLSKSNQKK